MSEKVRRGYDSPQIHECPAMSGRLSQAGTCPRLYVLDGVQSGVGHLTVALLDMTYRRHERHARIRTLCNALCEKSTLYSYSGLERTH